MKVKGKGFEDAPGGGLFVNDFRSFIALASSSSLARAMDDDDRQPPPAGPSEKLKTKLPPGAADGTKC